MRDKQIEKRVELLNYFISKSTNNVLDNRHIYILSTILLKQLLALIEKEIGSFLIYDVNFCDEKDEEAVNNIKDLAKKLGVIPIDTENVNSDKILVVDINYIPLKFRKRTVDDVKNRLQKEYGMRVFLIDSSRQNIQGASNVKPIYTI